MRRTRTRLEIGSPVMCSLCSSGGRSPRRGVWGGSTPRALPDQGSEAIEQALQAELKKIWSRLKSYSSLISRWNRGKPPGGSDDQNWASCV